MWFNSKFILLFIFCLLLLRLCNLNLCIHIRVLLKILWRALIVTHFKCFKKKKSLYLLFKLKIILNEYKN